MLMIVDSHPLLCTIQTKKSTVMEQQAKAMAREAEKKAFEAEQLKKQVHTYLHV